MSGLAKRAKPALKNLLCRYREDYTYINVHNLAHFVTTLKSRLSRLIDLIQRNAKTSDLLSILCEKFQKKSRI